MTIEAEEFLEMVGDGSFGEKIGGRRVIVRGNVDLRGHRLRDKITELPDVAITGDLAADGECALRVCKCRVTGDVKLDDSLLEEFSAEADTPSSVSGEFSAKGCARLRKISGKFLKDVHLDRSGVHTVGADFSCKGNLAVEGCRNITLLDCKAWSIIADGSSLRRLGPNIQADNISAEGCAELEVVTPIAGLRWAKFDGSGVRQVHPQFHCDGPVYLKRCRKLHRLAGSAASVEVSMAPLQDIPNFHANEAIFTDCAMLPPTMAGLHSKALIFARCTMEELPGGIRAGTALRVGACAGFSKLPKKWKGNLSLAQLPMLESTPKGFSCSGNLSVSECDNLQRISGSVGGGLQIMCGTPSLQSLGKDLEVGGDLVLAGDSSVSFLDCKVGGGVSAKGTKITETGGNLKVGGWADFTGCRKIGVVRGTFGGNVILTGSSVTHLGADFECGGDLLVDDTDELVALNCVVGGTAVAGESSLEKTGPAFRCGREFWARDCRRLKSVGGEVKGAVQINEEVRERLSREGNYRILGGGSPKWRGIARPTAGAGLSRRGSGQVSRHTGR